MTKAAKCVCMHARVKCLNMKLMSFPLKTFSEVYQANISSPQKTFIRLNLHQRFNRRSSSLFPLRENPVTLKRPPGPASALFVVTGRVCCTDAPSAAKGAPDVWKKCAGVRRQLPTQKEGMCGRQLKRIRGGSSCVSKSFACFPAGRLCKSLGFSRFWNIPKTQTSAGTQISQNVKC